MLRRLVSTGVQSDANESRAGCTTSVRLHTVRGAGVVIQCVSGYLECGCRVAVPFHDADGNLSRKGEEAVKKYKLKTDWRRPPTSMQKRLYVDEGPESPGKRPGVLRPFNVDKCERDATFAQAYAAPLLLLLERRPEADAVHSPSSRSGEYHELDPGVAEQARGSTARDTRRPRLSYQGKVHRADAIWVFRGTCTPKVSDSTCPVRSLAELTRRPATDPGPYSLNPGTGQSSWPARKVRSRCTNARHFGSCAGCPGSGTWVGIAEEAIPEKVLCAPAHQSAPPCLHWSQPSRTGFNCRVFECVFLMSLTAVDSQQYVPGCPGPHLF